MVVNVIGSLDDIIKSFSNGDAPFMPLYQRCEDLINSVSELGHSVKLVIPLKK